MKPELKKEIDMMLKLDALNKDLKYRRIQEQVENEDFYVEKQKEYAPMLETMKEVGLKTQERNKRQLLTLTQYIKAKDNQVTRTIQELPHLLGILPRITAQQKENNELGVLPIKYLQGLAHPNAYGIQYDTAQEKYFLGHSKKRYTVAFAGDEMKIWDTKTKKDLETITPTEGLWEILTRTSPTKGDAGEEFKYITEADITAFQKLATDYNLRHPSKSKTYVRFLSTSGSKTTPSTSHDTTEIPEDEEVFHDTTGAGIILPDDNAFLIDRFKGFLGHLYAGHTLDFNEAHHIADRLRQKKILTKKEYTKFTSKLNEGNSRR
jgi:hypothetical protein